MTIYEGIVTGLKEDRMAEVALGPRSQCIPHAPEASQKVCHTWTDSSTIVLEAFNEAAAEVGDMVSVNRKTSALVKNALYLLGTPLLGLALGITAALLINRGSPNNLNPFAGIAFLVIFLSSGLFLGIRTFRHAGGGGTPVIEGILRAGQELEAALEAGKGTDKVSRTCQTCHGFTSGDQ